MVKKKNSPKGERTARIYFNVLVPRIKKLNKVLRHVDIKMHYIKIVLIHKTAILNIV